MQDNDHQSASQFYQQLILVMGEIRCMDFNFVPFWGSTLSHKSKSGVSKDLFFSLLWFSGRRGVGWERTREGRPSLLPQRDVTK